MIGWEVVPRIGFGPLKVSPHGVGIALGVYVGSLLLARRARARGLDENDAWNAAAWGVAGAIVGARTAYVVGHLDEFDYPLEWLQIWRGGLSLMGSLIGAFLLAAVYFRRHRLDFFTFADLGAAGLAIGIAVGRIGDLMIGDHLGQPTSGWWGWVYKGGELISAPPCFGPSGPVYPTSDGCIAPGVSVHQTALYDMAWSLAIFGILLFFERRPRRRGFLFLTWVSLYAVGRIATDFLRVDKRWLDLGLTGSQITAIAALALCLYLLVRYRGLPERRDEEPTGPTGPSGAASRRRALSPDAERESVSSSGEASRREGQGDHPF